MTYQVGDWVTAQDDPAAPPEIGIVDEVRDEGHPWPYRVRVLVKDHWRYGLYTADELSAPQEELIAHALEDLLTHT